MILDRVANLFKLRPDPSDSDSEYYQLVKRGFRINIQPESPQYQALVGDTFGRTYRGFCTLSGIQINDKIVVSGTLTVSGKEYTVRGVADWNMPPLPHFEISLEESGV